MILLELSSLNNAVKAIQTSAELHRLESNHRGRGVMASSLLRSQEVTYSCLYARALDRFLFEKDIELGAVLHQGPSRKQPAKPGHPEQAVSTLYYVNKSQQNCVDIYLPICTTSVRVHVYK